MIRFPDFDLGFARALEWGRPALEEALGRDAAREVLESAKRHYDRLRPGVPALKTMGGRVNLAAAVVVLPVYLALIESLSRDRALLLAARFNEDFLLAFMNKKAAFFVRLAAKSRFAVRAAIRLMVFTDNRADDPNGWMYELLPAGKGHLADLNVKRCGAHKYLSENGASELTRAAICPLDDLFVAHIMPSGTILTRTQYQSEGAQCCDFRYILN